MVFLAEYIMRGRWQAILVATVLPLFSLVIIPLLKPFFALLSLATIALVTLRNGWLDGLILLLSASLATAVFAGLIVSNWQLSPYMLVSSLMMWFPVWLISIFLREGRHFELTIQLSVMLGALVVTAVYLFANDPAPSTFWQSLLEPLLTQLPENAPKANIEQMLDLVSHYMTGSVIASLLFSLMCGLFLGRWWQAALYNPGGFKKEFLYLMPSSWLAIFSILLLLLALLSSGIVAEAAWNVIIVLMVFYLLIGTAVLHIKISNWSVARYAVPMFYVSMLLIPHLLLPVALAGLLETWLDLRKIKSKTNAV